jgi:hypothetical protein
MIALSSAWTSATTSALADIGWIGPAVIPISTPTAAPIASRTTIAPMKKAARKPNSRQKFPAVSAQLRLRIATGPAPSALAAYRRAGFVPVGRAVERFPDPRLTGIVPATSAPQVPLLGTLA